ncbi:hypothetical protein CYMTET_39547 [Cymbomonas tetramitiformis]|uniref:Uncharacterized protein n=1 Tax=Cymbomonas tetramitiformis TaxID=36881 RepID=A0AAE0F3U4_9CHLO|nr:hypothetical protein CYMTET_39547 [Cymbomonas tetramitiformis]
MFEVARECFTDGVHCEHIQKNYDFESWMAGHHNDLHQISQQQTFKFFKDENGNVVMQHKQYSSSPVWLPETPLIRLRSEPAAEGPGYIKPVPFTMQGIEKLDELKKGLQDILGAKFTDTHDEFWSEQIIATQRRLTEGGECQAPPMPFVHPEKRHVERNADELPYPAVNHDDSGKPTTEAVKTEDPDSKDAKVSPEWRKRFEAFFKQYEEQLRASLPELSKLRSTKEDNACVPLKPDKEGGPPCRRPYKMSVEELRQLRERIEQLMEKGYIRPSSSPYAAPCLMVPKPGDPKTLRLVVDYRQLNQQTVRDRYPLPDIQLMFDEMQGAAFFSSFDAVDGFWQVPMAEEDVEKTAFTTQMGAYEWLVMPQGLQNSPSQYQRRMQRALGHLPFVRIFIDDCVVFSRTVEEHHEHCRIFLETCKEKGVYLKASKAKLCKESLRFLGHTLSAKGCQPQHDKIESVKSWPALETVTHQQWAFEELKRALSSGPVLALPDTKAAFDGSAPFLVQTDASGVALGGVLMQDLGNGMQPIAYESRQFSAAEQNYHTGERELCGLHHCTTVTWRHYLIFSEFKLQGDHRPLERLMSPGRELSRRQARWYMDLVEVGVPRMEYVKGALLLVPDALSRRPDYVEKTPRQGLKDAGVVNPITDLPSDPTSVLDTNDIFEDKPPDPAPPWLAELGAWTEAVSTLQVAEAAMEQHGSLKAELAAGVTTRGKAKTVSFAGSDPPSSSPVLDAPVGGKPGRPRGRLPKGQLADRQDWKVCPEVFDRLQEQYGKFDVDACCDIGGKNRQVEQYWSDCLSELWRGKHVWCNPPYSSSHITIEAVLLKYLEEWKADPENTSAVFLLPDLQKRMPQWRSIFRRAGMQVREVIPTHDAQGVATQLYMTPDGKRHDLPWPVLVVYAPPARRQQNRVRYPRVTPPIVQTGEAARVRDQHDPPTDTTFLKALREEYDRAGPLHDLRAKVLASPHRMTRDFRVVGDVLWRVAAGRYQLVLGEDSPLREVIFQEAHDSLTAGHTGREKTLERVLRRFWWKNATDDVAAWVSSCPTCQSVRPRASFPDGLLNPHAIPARNWQVVGVDFVTGLPMTTQGNDAFATFTCKLSKMVHVVPIHFGDSSAQTVARIYFDVVWRQHGAPMKIVCDRYPRFQDAFWRELMRLMGVRVASTTPYNPRSDGQAEASNRVVEDMLRSFVGANADDWDLYATNVEFAINDSRSEATGFTPFELCYGVSPMSQLDLFLEAAAEPGAQRRKGGVGTAHEMAVKFSSQLRDARARLELAQQRQRAQFDQRHSQQEYQVGDLVWIEAKHLTEKLMDRKLCRKLGRRWHGPVPVVERFYSDLQAELPEAERGAPVAYRLRLPPHWLIHDVFAQHRLKPHVGGEDSFARRSVIPIPEPVMVDGQAEAYVDKILAYRVRSVRGKQVEEWKVRWVGFSSAHDQWRTRDKMNRGGENQQLKEFEEERLRRQRESMQEVAERRRRLRDAAVDTAAAAEVTLAQLIQHPCDEPEPAVSEEACLPWESLCTLDDGEVARVTEADWGDERPVRILVMFSGTGSVEKQFDKCFPHSQAVTVDHDPLWRATHVNTIEDWDYRQYPPGYFDVIWASPPCTQYSQARTTGGPPDLQSADECVQRTLDIIEYFKPEHWFLENPEGRFPNALRLRPIMDKLPEPLLCTYCKYGKRYRKPTCIWTSSPPQTPLLQCTADTPCAYRWATGGHPDTAQVGPHPDQTGARDSRAVYPIPGPLLYHLFHALQYGRLALKQDPAA